MKKKILLIEDEVSLRELYAEVLNDNGYEVIQAGDGETAGKLINSGNWDMVLLDIMLPKLDGIEVLKQLSVNPALSKKTALVLSNLDNEAIVKQCLQLGAKEYLTKANINPQQLLDIINRYFPE